jgi:hypothetical protein
MASINDIEVGDEMWCCLLVLRPHASYSAIEKNGFQGM